MHKFRQALTVYGVLFFTFTLNACAGVRVWPEQVGQVLDEATKQPIADAIVVALWKGSRNVAFVDTQTTCYHVETTKTDKAGHFKFSSRFDGLMRSQIYDKYLTFTVYKAGYVTSDKTYEEGAQRNNIHYLKPFKGTREERLEYLVKLGDVTRCSAAGDTQKKLILLKEKIYDEAKPLAVSDKEIYHLDTILFGLDSLRYGDEEARKRLSERMKARR